MAKLLDVVEGWTDELGPFTLKADGVAVDLTGLTVALVLTDVYGATVTVAGTTRVDGTPSTGRVYYTPAAGDLRNALQPYKLRWRVTDGADVVFFPNAAADTIAVFKP